MLSTSVAQRRSHEPARVPLIGRRTFATLALAAIPGFARATRPFRVALIMNGTIGDGGWNQLAYMGLQQVSRAGCVTGYAENVAQADVMAMSRGYAEDGYDLVIGHGFEFTATFQEIGPDYPDQSFFVTAFAPDDTIPKNVAFVDMNYYALSYAAGALAALIAPAGRGVGFVGGQDNPSQRRMMYRFEDGARATVPGINAMGIVPGDFNNASLGREAASTMIGHGAGVIWHAADVTGLGALRGAEEAGVRAIGCYTDQWMVAPKAVASSTVINIPWMVEEIVRLTQARAFPGGGMWTPRLDQLWAMKWRGGTVNPALVTAAAADRFAQIWSGLSNGTINPQPATGG
jgi:basic membrane protein A and related proteins